MNESTLVLAAICQFAQAVQDIARKGRCDDDTLTLALESIINTSPENTLAVYGGDLKNLRQGLLTLRTYLGDDDKQKDTEVTRYIVGLMALERKLAKNKLKLNELGTRIDDINRQLGHFELISDSILSSFAAIYADVVSPLGARIQVAGDPNLLQQAINQHKIRALLLAGIRAVVLWRQVGGKRRHILFKRKLVLASAKNLFEQI